VTAYLTALATEGCIFSIMALGLNVIWGWAGDLDLAFYGYVAVGAYMAMVTSIGRLPAPAQYVLGWHLPFPLAALIATASAALLALGVGAVALRRLRAVYFAIITLSAVLMLQTVISDYTPLFNGFDGLYGMPQPFNDTLHLAPQAYSVFFVGFALLCLAVVYVLLDRLSRSPFGRALRAVREQERAAAAFGRSVYALKLTAYVLGAALGGFGGALLAASQGAFNPTAWPPTETLDLYVAIFVGGMGNIRGVILGVFLVLVLFQESTRFVPALWGNPNVSVAVREILLGVMILVTMRYRIQGLWPDGAKRVRRPARPAAGTGPVLLEVRGLSKRFGGAEVVRDCSFEVREGTVVGLIGPNGAGKSTAVELITGFARPDAGVVRFAGREIQGWAPDRIARLGLIRTFQLPHEWPGLTVLENMILAAPAKGRDAIWRPFFAAGALRRAEAADRERAADLLDTFGLLEHQDELAGTLSGGEKRLLEFARIAMAQPRLMILDEPMGGVNPVLGARIADAIARLVALGVTVVIVEHDLAFVERVCDVVIVMALGAAIATGPLPALRADRAVIDAYLGEAAVHA